MADDVEILIRPTGPYIVRGRIRLKDAGGTEFDLGGREDIALCRCGASSTKPFCDGTHSKIGFLGAMEAVKKTD